MAPLVGRRVAAAGPGYQSPHGLAQELDGCVLESVEARGKHLLATFDSGRILHSHLRMTGAWHIYADGRPWARSPRSAWLTLSANGICAVAVRRARAGIARPCARRPPPPPYAASVPTCSTTTRRSASR